jgi:hypothetical protein
MSRGDELLDLAEAGSLQLLITNIGVFLAGNSRALFFLQRLRARFLFPRV